MLATAMKRISSKELNSRRPRSLVVGALITLFLVTAPHTAHAFTTSSSLTCQRWLVGSDTSTMYKKPLVRTTHQRQLTTSLFDSNDSSEASAANANGQSDNEGAPPVTVSSFFGAGEAQKEASTNANEPKPATASPTTAAATTATPATTTAAPATPQSPPNNQKEYGKTLDYPSTFVRCGKCQSCFAIAKEDLGNRGSGRYVAAVSASMT